MENNLARLLLILGILFIIASVLVENRVKIPLGRLPGDIIIKRENFTFYFPLVTSILISIILTIIFSLMKRWR